MEALLRGLAREAVLEEAETALRGIRRLTVLHGLRPENRDQVEELLDLVDDVCDHHGISTAGGTATSLCSGQWQGPSRTTWRFQPPDALHQLSTVRAALATRYPHWTIEADDY